jgi:uncharacterized protein YndB with AHSA1/START domain
VASYSFLTTWLLEAPREPVFEAIHDQERWPQWWRGVEEAEEIEPGDDDGVGSVSRLVWRSRLPYRVKFEVTTRRVERPHLMEGHAVGELTGVGRWRFFERDGVTAVLYEWDVSTRRRWMNALAPIAGPVFAWNHDWVMARGGRGSPGCSAAGWSPAADRGYL